LYQSLTTIFQVLWDQKVLKVLKESLDLKVNLDHKEKLVLLVLKVLQVLEAYKEKMVLKVHREKEVHRVLLVLED
jgi:hypothetical protein